MSPTLILVAGVIITGICGWLIYKIKFSPASDMAYKVMRWYDVAGCLLGGLYLIGSSIENL